MLHFRQALWDKGREQADRSSPRSGVYFRRPRRRFLSRMRTSIDTHELRARRRLQHAIRAASHHATWREQLRLERLAQEVKVGDVTVRDALNVANDMRRRQQARGYALENIGEAA